MKQVPPVSSLLRFVFCGAAITASALTVSAQVNISEGFDNTSIWAQTNQTSLATWQWWGGCSTAREWSTNDAGGSASSGSVKISITWPATVGSGDWQYSVGMPLSGIGNYDGSVSVNPLSYTNFEFDLMWDTNSTADVAMNSQNNGDPHYFGLGFANPTWGQNWVPNANQPVPVNDGQWHHYSIPLNQAWAAIPGLIFKKWRPNNDALATNNAGLTTAFYVDNLRFNYNTNQVIPKPTMTIKKAEKGLNLIAAASGNQYQRVSVRSVPSDTVEWYGNPNPVTYSLTIAEMPDGTAYGGYAGHIYLSPDGGTTAPDWNNPNCIVVNFNHNGDGSGFCNFRYKTNAPNSNGILYGAGTVAGLWAPTIRGTWSVTFSNNSNVTIVGPGGSSTNFDIGSEAATYFDSQSSPTSMATYFGIVPGQPGNIGQRATYSRIKITDGATVVVDDTFPVSDVTQESDPTLWINQIDGGLTSIKVVDQDAYWVDWNKPDALLSALQASSSLTTGWADAGLTIRDHATRRGVYAGTNFLINYPNALYLRLMQN